MKTHKPASKSSTLLTTQLKKQGLELVPEYMDPALGLGPIFTVNALKSGTSNSDVSYRLYYAGEASRYSASHRNAVARAAAKKEKQQQKQQQRGNLVSGAEIPARVGGKTGVKLGLVKAAMDVDMTSETASDASSESSRSSVSAVSE